MINQKSILLVLISIFLPAFLLFLMSCKSDPQSKEDFIFNTVCQIVLYDSSISSFKKSKALDECFHYLRVVDRELDVVDPQSELNQILKKGSIINSSSNSSKQNEIVLTGNVATLLRLSFEKAAELKGYFDPTIEPLVKCWNIGMGGDHIPSQDAIQNALQSVGWKKVSYEKRGSKVVLTKYPQGFALDFGAVAKGFAADGVIKRLKTAGFTQALINIGGNVSVLGTHPESRPWRIGIQDPNQTRGNYCALIKLEEKSASTSGVYERFFFQEGKRYHHLLDPFTGYPAENDLLSVTVVCAQAVLTDIYSTALFVMGKSGEQVVLDTDGLEAAFVYRNGEIRVSPGLREKVKKPSDSWMIKQIISLK